jgi:hypothetical protein
MDRVRRAGMAGHRCERVTNLPRTQTIVAMSEVPRHKIFLQARSAERRISCGWKPSRKQSPALRCRRQWLAASGLVCSCRRLPMPVHWPPSAMRSRTRVCSTRPMSSSAPCRCTIPTMTPMTMGGSETASGELYDPVAWTAAIQIDLRDAFGGVHYGWRYHPAFALVESGGKRAIIKINDVGPLRPGRVIDFNQQTMRYFDPPLQRRSHRRRDDHAAGRIELDAGAAGYGAGGDRREQRELIAHLTAESRMPWPGSRGRAAPSARSPRSARPSAAPCRDSSSPRSGNARA